MNYRLLYFAALAEAVGAASEAVSSDAADAAGLYAQMSERHGFTLPRASVRVAINGEFAHWQQPLADDDEVAFLPPVSGG